MVGCARLSSPAFTVANKKGGGGGGEGGKSAIAYTIRPGRILFVTY